MKQALFTPTLPFPVVSHILIEEESAMAGIRVALVISSSPSMPCLESSSKEYCKERILSSLYLHVLLQSELCDTALLAATHH